MVQELLSGDLYHALSDPKQEAELRWNQRGKSVALDIALGLRLFHTNAILHLDIK